MTAEALSPDGKRLFVVGYTSNQTKSETVAYDTATGAQLWAKTYLPLSGTPDAGIAVSPDGTQVYVTTQDAVTIAYAAGTGRQLWAIHSKGVGGQISLAVSPDGTTIYVAATGRLPGRHHGRRVPGRGSDITVIAYAAGTGQQRWLRQYSEVKGVAVGLGLGAVGVSPDGRTVYVAGDAGAELPSSYSLVVLAYRAAGTLKWARLYANRYTGGKYAGGAFAGPVVVGPGGGDLYVDATVSTKSGHYAAATFAFRAATGTCLWQVPDRARGGAGKVAVTPDSRTVIFVGDRTGDLGGGYAISSYDASTGATRWARRAPVPGNAPSHAAGVVMDPSGDTVFVDSSNGGGYDLAAWSVARGTVLWTTRYPAAHAYYPVAIALSRDGTRLFVTGSVLTSGSMTTVAYRT